MSHEAINIALSLATGAVGLLFSLLSLYEWSKVRRPR